MKENTPTRELVIAAQGGNRAAFDGLFQRFEDRLRKIVKSLIGDHLQSKIGVDDVIQETFAKAYQSSKVSNGGERNRSRAGCARFRRTLFCMWLPVVNLRKSSNLEAQGQAEREAERADRAAKAATDARFAAERA